MGLPLGEGVLTSASQALRWHANIQVKPGENAMMFYARKCLSYSTVGVMYSLICFSYLSKLQFEDSYQT